MEKIIMDQIESSTPISKARKSKLAKNPNLPVSKTNPIIDLEKALDLRIKGLTFEEIAQYFGVAKTSVYERLQGYLPETTNVKAFTKHRADILAAKQDIILNSLTCDDLQKASPYQKVGMFGILYNNERLERGKSTQNVAFAEMSKDMREMDSEIKKLEADLGELSTES